MNVVIVVVVIMVVQVPVFQKNTQVYEHLYNSTYFYLIFQKYFAQISLA